jgi:hypothetical protein
MKRGAKSLSARDWLFGSRPRRLALEALLADPGRRWSKAALARAADVDPHGGIDEHVAGFAAIGLIVREDRHYVLAEPPPDFAGALRVLLGELRAVSDSH